MNNDIDYKNFKDYLYKDLIALSKIELIKNYASCLGKKELVSIYDIDSTFKHVARAKLRKELYKKEVKGNFLVRLNKKSISIKILNKEMAEYFIILHRYFINFRAPDLIISNITDFINLFDEETSNSIKNIIPSLVVLKAIENTIDVEYHSRVECIKYDGTYNMYFSMDRQPMFDTEIGIYNNEKEIINNFKSEGYSREIDNIINAIKIVEEIVLNLGDKAAKLINASFNTNSKAMLADLNKASLKIDKSVLDDIDNLTGRSLSLKMISSVEEQLINIQEVEKEKPTIEENTSEPRIHLSFDELIFRPINESENNELSIETLFGESFPHDMEEATNDIN